MLSGEPPFDELTDSKIINKIKIGEYVFKPPEI